MAAEVRIIVNSSASGGGIAQTTKDLRELDTTARGGGQGFTVLGGAIASAMGGMAVAAIGSAASAMGDFLASSVGAASEFEAGMNQFAAAAGNMGQEEIGEFQELFLDLGKKLPVSTKEVQDAAIALVKGGLDPAVVSAGALEDSLLFAAAAGMGLEEAAELGVKMLGTFVPVTASAAEQVDFLAESQELLVKAANASTLNVDALGDAMLAAGGQARAAGLDYDDFVTTMGLISPAFGSAAEAGTSFKNFLVRLQPTTKDQIALFHDLNLITEEGQNVFYDAQGNFLGMENAAEKLKVALGGLSEQERLKTMQTLFGNDAMGAASALAEGGAEAYQAFAQKMAEANGITAQTEATQKGLGFAMENAKGSVEALQITIGMMLMPVLTDLINNVVTPAINTLSTMAEALGGNKEAFESLPGPLQNVVAGLQGLFEQAQGIPAAIDEVRARVDAFFNTPLGTMLKDGATAVAGYFANDFQTDLNNGVALAEAGLDRIAESDFGQRVQRGAQVVADYMVNDWPQDFQNGIALVESYLAPFAPTVQTAMNEQKKAWEGMASYVLDEWPTDFQNGVDMVVSFVNELPGKAQTAFDDFKTALVNLPSTLMAEAENVGNAIVDGIASGITAGAGAIADAARDAASAAFEAAKKLLGIASPSKVFAEQVGVPMAQGMAAGMIQATPAVVDAASYASRAALGGASTTVNRSFTYAPTISTGSVGVADLATARALARGNI